MLAPEKQDILATATAPANQVPQLTPRCIKIAAAVRYSSLSRSKIYELLEARKIKSYRIGSSRLLDLASLDAFILSQPAN